MKITKQDMKLHVYPSGGWYIDWIKNELRHREDGPAEVRKSGAKFYWLKNDKLHSEDGPARTFNAGIKSFYLNGEGYGEEYYWKEVHENY